MKLFVFIIYFTAHGAPQTYIHDQFLTEEQCHEAQQNIAETIQEEGVVVTKTECIPHVEIEKGQRM
jgi:hypothetical protein